MPTLKESGNLPRENKEALPESGRLYLRNLQDQWRDAKKHTRMELDHAIVRLSDKYTVSSIARALEVSRQRVITIINKYKEEAS